MINWRDMDKVAVMQGIDQNGNRYLNQFLKDYSDTFGVKDINAGCSRCLDEYWNRFRKHQNTMKKVKNSGYKLKAKFEGIPLEFGSQIQVDNGNLSDEYAKKLIADHKLGEDLFDELPSEDAISKEEELKVLVKLERKELNVRAEGLGLDPKQFANKTSIAEAISQAEEADVKTDKGVSEEEE